MKAVFASLAIITVIIGYIPYLRDTFSGKTKPHVFSWFIWSLVSFIAFGLQITNKGGLGSLINLAMTIVCFTIFLRSLHNGTKEITRFDFLSLFTALIAVVLWLIVKQPLWSIILISLIDFFSFLPTISKSWNKPNQETLFTWVLSCFRHVFTIISLSNLNIITALYPSYSLVINSIFCGMLIWRRRKITN